jgi:hypothetical protein
MSDIEKFEAAIYEVAEQLGVEFVANAIVSDE